MHRHPRLLILALLTAIAPPSFAAAPLGEQVRALLRADELDAAAELLEARVESVPDDAEAHNLLGAVYGRQALAASVFGKLPLARKAKGALERAVALAPDSVPYREALFQYYVAAPGIAGGGADKARLEAAEIAKRDPLRGDLAYAALARLEGKPDEALARMRAAIARQPDDARIALQLGLLLQDLKRFDEAFAHFQAMTAKDPAALPAWYQIGRTAVMAKTRLAEGEAAFKRYLAGSPGEQDPPRAAAHWRLGMLYELAARVADAQAQYQAALKLDPAHAEAKAALAKMR